jgi:hypothetical protein
MVLHQRRRKQSLLAYVGWVSLWNSGSTREKATGMAGGARRVTLIFANEFFPGLMIPLNRKLYSSR